MATFSSQYIEVQQHKRVIVLTKLPASVLTEISYAAVRGQSNEEGAIQRILNTRRVNGVKEFTLNGGEFPASIVLNWVSEDNLLSKELGSVSFDVLARSAQIVDGQHRVEGIREAILMDHKIENLELCVAIYEHLTTKECADIFLSINTEQKPVDRSLVFDLYGIVNDYIVDPAAVRARDIAMFLNDSTESPYADCIKLPGQPRRKGGIALSTVVSAIKPLVEAKGSLEQIGINELEAQKRILLNLFSAISGKYLNEWYDSTNVFQYAAGFVGAIEFLKVKLIPYCLTKRSFEENVISRVLKLEKGELIHQSDVKGMAGTEASGKVFNKLVEIFSPERNEPVMRY